MTTTTRFERPQQARRLPGAVWVMCLLVAAYCVFFGRLAIARHSAHLTSVFDLGVYDQAIWSTAHGQVLRYTAEPGFGDNFLATHLQPILILLAPLYWLWDDVRVLFIVQTLALALGAVPLFWLARWKTRSSLAAVLVGAAYLLLPAMEAANLFDFHPETFAPVLWLSLFCLLETRLAQAKDDGGPLAISHRMGLPLFWILLLLILGVKEDMALIVVAFGLYVIVLRRSPGLGSAIVLLAVAWFIVGIYGIMPYFHHGELSPFLSYYASLGSTPQQIVWNALTKPSLTFSLLSTRENGIALLAFLLPLAFVPLLDLPVFLIAAPALLLNALSENPLMHRMEGQHYAAPIIPFAMLASVYGLGRARNWAAQRGFRPLSIVRSAVLLMLGTTMVYHYYRGFTPLSRLYDGIPSTAHDQLAQALESTIPPDATLVAQDRLYPHLSHRAQISFLFPEQDSTDYVFLDVAHTTFVNDNDIHTWLRQQVFNRTGYGVVESRDGYIVLQRGAAHGALTPDFYSFAAGSAAAITHPLTARFGNELEFEGFNLHTTRDQESTFETFWRVLKDTVPDRLPNLYLLDASGRSIAETRFAQPGLVWYPTSHWRAGQLVRLVFNTLTWTTDDLENYTVALSVLDKPDPRAATRALIVETPDGQGSERLLHSASMFRLGDFHRQFGYTWLER